MDTKVVGGGGGGKPLTQRLNEKGEVVWEKGDERLVHRLIFSPRVERRITLLETLRLSLQPWVSEIVIRRPGRRGRRAVGSLV